jgi:hypothetical protein
MTNAPMNDADLTAWLCANLRDLTDAANQDRWAEKLDTAINAIRAGTPAAQALANQHLPRDIIAAASDEQACISKGDPGTLDDFNIDQVVVTGRYTCPVEPPAPRCFRRAQPDQDGHEPRCQIHDATMTLRG